MFRQVMWIKRRLAAPVPLRELAFRNGGDIAIIDAKGAPEARKKFETAWRFFHSARGPHGSSPAATIKNHANDDGD
jgi:hypothetical protein